MNCHSLVERESSCIPLRVTGLPQRSAPTVRTYPAAADALSLRISCGWPATAEALRTLNASHDEADLAPRQFASLLDLFQPSLTLRVVGTDDGYQSRREPLGRLVNARRDAADRVAWCHSPYLSRLPTDLTARQADLMFASPSPASPARNSKAG